MRSGIIIETNDPEMAWNAVRFGNAALGSGHETKIFLISAGVEIESLSVEKYDVGKQLHDFSEAGGVILACGTCLKSRNQTGSDICPMSTMRDCVEMVAWADKTVTI